MPDRAMLDAPHPRRVDWSDSARPGVCEWLYRARRGLCMPKSAKYRLKSGPVAPYPRIYTTMSCPRFIATANPDSKEEKQIRKKNTMHSTNILYMTRFTTRVCVRVPGSTDVDTDALVHSPPQCQWAIATTPTMHPCPHAQTARAHASGPWYPPHKLCPLE